MKKTKQFLVRKNGLFCYFLFFRLKKKCADLFNIQKEKFSKILVEQFLFFYICRIFSLVFGSFEIVYHFLVPT